MDMKIFNTNYSSLLKKAIDVYDKQHEAIAQNVANANTDNYKRVNTDFPEQLQSAMDTSGMRISREKHIRHANFNAGSSSENKSDAETSVDIAREMTDLSVNQIRHELVTRALARYYSGITAVLVGRNR